MMFHLLKFFILIFLTRGSTCLQPITPPKATPTLDPICIVGAGISGLSLGNLLIANPKNPPVLLFERNAVVGGKIATFRVGDEIQVEKGAVVFSPWNNDLLEYIHKFNLKHVRFNNSDAGAFNPVTGSLYDPPQLTSTQQAILLRTAERYSTYRTSYVQNGAIDFGYVQASTQPELFEPTLKWLSDRRLDLLIPIFRVLMTAEGYGSLEDTPALYTLKLIEPTLLINVTMDPQGGFRTLQNGLDVLMHKMAESLNVKLNHQVVRVSRQNSKSTRLIMTTQNVDRLEYTRCSNVILAFPPTLPNVQQTVQDLTKEEMDVLSEVRVHKYTTGVHHIPAWNKTIYSNVAFMDMSIPKLSTILTGTGQPILFSRQSLKKKQNMYASYSWIRGQFTELPSQIELDLIDQKLEKFLNEMSGSLAHMTYVKPNQKQEYFPHVTTSSLRKGFYKKFDKIQGVGGLYYATTLLGFEGMDLAIKMTNWFVEKYF